MRENSHTTFERMRKNDASDAASAPALVLGATERKKLGALTLCAERTLLRWARGEEIRESTKAAIDTAARKLGIPLPRSNKT